MLCAILILGLAGLQTAAGAVLDRIAVIAGKHAIKTSDIERDLRVTEFLNRAPLDLGSAAKKQSADRLVNQAIIRDEITSGEYDRATDSDAEKTLADLRHDRFGGSEARLQRELSKYGLTENELKDQLLWQLTVLRFIDERFRPAAMVQEQDVKNYYDAHLAELKRQYPGDSSYAAVQPKIETLLQGQQVDKLFDAWLDDARKTLLIEYRQEAFQ